MRKKKVKNGKVYFIQTMVMALICFCVFMILKGHIDLFDLGIPGIIMGIVYFLYVFVAMKCEMKYTRSWLSIITNVMIPPVVYVTYCIGLLNKKTIILILFYIATFIMVEFFFTANTAKNKKKVVKKYVFSKLKYELIFVIIASVILLSVFFPELKNKVLGEIPDKKETKTVEIVVGKDKYLIEDNLKEISKIEKWKILSDKEKKELLSLFVKIESSSYGMDTVPNLVITELEDNCMGKYSREYDTIYIDSNLCKGEGDPYEVLLTLCHEMSHRFQHIEVELMEQIMEDPDYAIYHNSKIFADSKVYAQEFQNYVAGDTDETYQEYLEQNVEIKADYDAKNAVYEYKTRIEEYLNQNT